MSFPCSFPIQAGALPIDYEKPSKGAKKDRYAAHKMPPLPVSLLFIKKSFFLLIFSFAASLFAATLSCVFNRI